MGGQDHVLRKVLKASERETQRGPAGAKPVCLPSTGYTPLTRVESLAVQVTGSHATEGTLWKTRPLALPRRG